MNRHCYFERTYFTLEDVIKLADGENINHNYLLGQEFDDAFIGVLQTIFPYPDLFPADPLTSSEVNKLWCCYIVPKYLDNIVCYKDDDDELVYDDKCVQHFMTQVCSIIQATYDKYKQILDIYSDEETDLMAQVKASNTIKFNDTPQSSGDHTFDDYVSTYTKSENASDVGTPIARIDEIHRLYHDVYSEWADEFGGLFMYA